MAKITQIEIGETLQIAPGRRLVYVGNGMVAMELRANASGEIWVRQEPAQLTQPQIDAWVDEKNNTICAGIMGIDYQGKRQWQAA
jgi:hypothetical protein